MKNNKQQMRKLQDMGSARTDRQNERLAFLKTKQEAQMRPQMSAPQMAAPNAAFIAKPLPEAPPEGAPMQAAPMAAPAPAMGNATAPMMQEGMPGGSAIQQSPMYQNYMKLLRNNPAGSARGPVQAAAPNPNGGLLGLGKAVSR